MSSKYVDIVVPTIRPECIKVFSERLVEGTTTPFRLIVINDGNPNVVPTICDKITDRTYLVNIERKGIAVSWNMGLRTSNTPYVAVLNDDTYPFKMDKGDWLTLLTDYLDMNPKVGIVSPVWRLGPQPEYELCKNRICVGTPNVTEEGIQGFAFVVKRKMVEQLMEIEKGEPNPGLFDENYPLMWEDTDYVHRVTRAGWQCKVWHGVDFYHEGSVAIGTMPQRGSLYNIGYNRFLTKFKLPLGVPFTVHNAIYEQIK